ncbi:hypothetical protein YTPLAS73_04440 [Nitrosarchaeum sp.]|nr:hypothetical protein YTPLAS73_04440 [Nitrosarchaeum sp.]
MINPKLMDLLDNIDTLDILRDSTVYQLQKMQNVEKTLDGKDWYQDLPQIVKNKFNDYKEAYASILGILKSDHQIMLKEMNKGYYYWRLLRSACNTYQNDLVEFDQQLVEEFNFKETKAISNNEILKNCLKVLIEHAVED